MKKYIFILLILILSISVTFAFEQSSYDFSYSSITNFSIQNVNSSDFWDSLDTPSDISTADLTDDNTYVQVAGDSMTGDYNTTGDVTMNDLTLTTAGIDWKTTARGNFLGFQPQTAGQSTIELWDYDGLGNNAVGFNIFQKGSPADITQARLFQFTFLTDQLRMRTLGTGAEVDLPISIGVGVDPYQIWLTADSSVGIGVQTTKTNSFEVSKDAYFNEDVDIAENKYLRLGNDFWMKSNDELTQFNVVAGYLTVGGETNYVKFDGNGNMDVDGYLNVIGNISINSNLGYTGTCVNATYMGGIAIGCND